MKILFITNVPSPYRVDFFNELGKYCDLTVLFEKSNSKERDKSWMEYQFRNFEGIFLKGLEHHVDTSICFDVIRYVKNKKYDEIICSDFTSPTGMLAVKYMKCHHIHYYLESDGGFPKDGIGIKEKIKKYIISKAKGYFSTGVMHDQYYLTYGAEKEKIIRYPFSSVKEEQILSEPVTAEQKVELRKKLGITEEKIVLTVGQFIHRKGFDILLESAKDFEKNTGFYFVGGEPTEQYLDMKEQYQISNVHFIGFKKPDILKEYYMAADIFVLPTREDIWGLVINEAIACGLPVVTTDRCLAGIEMITPDKHGAIVRTEDTKALSMEIQKILGDDKLRSHMVIENLKNAHNYTIESMVAKHLEILGITKERR